MAITKTQCGWMVLGGILCLCGIFFVCKVREGNRLTAQGGPFNPPDPQLPLPQYNHVAGGEKTGHAFTEPAPADNDADKFEAAVTGTPPAPPALPQGAEQISKPKINVPPPVEIAKAPEAAPPPPATPLMPLVDPSEPLPPIKEVPAPKKTASVVVVIPPAPVKRPAVPSLEPTAPAPTVAIVPAAPVGPLPTPTPVAPSITPPSAPAPAVVIAPTPEKAPPTMTVPSTLTGSTPLPVLTLPSKPAPPVQRAEFRQEANEPPLDQHNGPVQVYRVKHEGETPREIARKTLGSPERCDDVLKLNPDLKSETRLAEGALVKLPADACLPTDDVESVQPLPVLRKPAQVRSKVLPLTGTFPCNLDDKHTITLPRAIRDQLGQGNTVLLSPGSDQCLWLTNHAHLERLTEHLEHSPAKEVDVRVFKRLYYAQTEKATVSADGRVQISDRLAQYAGLHQEVVLVGIDDHFELWDVGRWKEYTQQKSAAARAALGEE